MGLFSAHEVTPAEITDRFGQHFVDGEEVLIAFRTVRDTAFLTNYRFVLIDVQGLTGAKVDVQSIPYRSIVRFSVESAGTLDLDADLKIWVSSRSAPIEVKVSRKADAARVQQVLAARVLGTG